ncbi:ABC transporter permease [Amycolatopsis balhimycina DSM 5908]|uniref:ABC transporter permease n=1 Tax=Amycolatopsis balhimycina DSM 5908 TaxID=1081091 RepID=A0A428WQT9_AMYBA|nr:ABC transporter permease [Amycolatopsis balhimycina]RSM45457.1 ABC transporter permease [Amycolatopsis balhimycina DSM 5908]
MNSLQIALRVLRVDRRTRTSAVLTAIGVAVATGLVLLLATLPFATQHREQRALWQGEHFFSRGSDGPVKMVYASSKDYFDGRQIIRVDVALTPGAAGIPLPAGVPQLPGPGETVVSPALGRLLQAHPGGQLADRFGKPVGAIGEDGLRFPEQLVALTGHTPDAMPENASQVAAFPGGKASPDPLLTLLSWVGIIVLLVPSLVLVASSARLTAARRERRLAAIRLAGATPGQVTNMVAAETTLSAGIGAVLGLLISPALRGLASFVPWAGGTWLASDFALPIGLTVFIVLAIPVLVVLAGVLGLRRVLKNPLFATGGHTKKPLHWWRLLALPAAGLFFLVAVTTAKDSDSGGIGLVMAGLCLLVGSAAIVGPWVTSAVGGTFVRIWRRPSALLAGRRLRDDPKGAYRASAGIVLAVFTGSMALTLLPTFESMAGGGRSFSGSVFYVDADAPHASKIVDQANAALQKYGQSEKAVAVGEVYLVRGQVPNRYGHRALVMTCADAVKLTRFGLTQANCTGGPAVFGDSALDLAQYKFATNWEGEAVAAKSGTRVEAVHYPDSDLSGTFVIDPAALPDGVAMKDFTVVAPTTDANREIVRTALAGPAAGAEVGSRDQYLVNQQTELGDLRRVTVIGLIAAGILAGCSAAVATAGSVMDRRRTFGALMAAGTPVRVLARALRMEAALPALVATIGAGIVGVLVGVGLYSLVDARGIVLSPWLLAPVVLGVGVALLGASVCTPALKRVQAEPLADE